MVVVATAMLLAAWGSSTTPTYASASKQPTVSVANANAVPVNNPGEIWTFGPEGCGTFAAEHLKVSQLYNNGGAPALTQVATGHSQFSETSPEDLIDAINVGEPLSPLATLITSSIYACGVPASSAITSWAQLKGKSIGVSSLTSGSDPFAAEGLAVHGLTSDVSISVISNGGPAADAIKGGTVAAACTTDTQWVTIKSLGVKIRFLPERPSQSLPADLFYTSNQFYDSYRGVCVRFMAAIFAAIARTEATPVQAVAYFQLENPTLTPAADLALLKARLARVELIPAQHGKWGYIPWSLFDKVQQLGLKYKVITRAANPKKIFSNSLIGSIDSKVKALLKSVKTK